MQKDRISFDYLAVMTSLDQDVESEDDASMATPLVDTPTTSAATSVDGRKPRDEQALNFASVPCQGHVFVMRSTSCGRFLNAPGHGEVVLMQPVSPIDTSWKWECVETNGYFGFRNIKTGRFLGHGGWSDTLQCSEAAHKGWEMFQVRPHPQGGYVMLMEHWFSAWPIGIKIQRGMERLAKINAKPLSGLVWDFAIVDEANNDKYSD